MENVNAMLDIQTKSIFAILSNITVKRNAIF